MSDETLSAQVWKLLLRFRKNVWFRVTYLVLMGIIVSFLLVFTAGGLGCLVILAAPLLVFLVPYYFGERSLKRFALNALPVILIAILLGGALQTSALYSQRIPIQSAPGPFMSPTMALSNGTVIPLQSDSPRAFTFRVKLTSTVNATPDMFAVSLNLTTVTGLNDYPMSSSPMVNITVPGSFNNTRLGTWFETSVNLSTSIYAYGFSVWDRRANWTFTNVDIGPLTAPVASYYGLFAYFTSFSMILPFAFYYIILFMWWYTVRQRATRTRMLGAEPQIPKEKSKPKAELIEPTKSEKASKAAAFTCTNCGADVDESAEKCPNCGAVFEG